MAKFDPIGAIMKNGGKAYGVRWLARARAEDARYPFLCVEAATDAIRATVKRIDTAPETLLVLQGEGNPPNLEAVWPKARGPHSIRISAEGAAFLANYGKLAESIEDKGGRGKTAGRRIGITFENAGAETLLTFQSALVRIAARVSLADVLMSDGAGPITFYGRYLADALHPDFGGTVFYEDALTPGLIEQAAEAPSTVQDYRTILMPITHGY